MYFSQTECNGDYLSRWGNVQNIRQHSICKYIQSPALISILTHDNLTEAYALKKSFDASYLQKISASYFVFTNQDCNLRSALREVIVYHNHHSRGHFKISYSSQSRFRPPSLALSNINAIRHCVYIRATDPSDLWHKSGSKYKIKDLTDTFRICPHRHPTTPQLFQKNNQYAHNRLFELILKVF